MCAEPGLAGRSPVAPAECNDSTSPTTHPATKHSPSDKYPCYRLQSDFSRAQGSSLSPAGSSPRLQGSSHDRPLDLEIEETKPLLS